MPILLGAFGKDLAALKGQRGNGALETLPASGQVHFAIQSGAASARCFATGAGIQVLAAGDICGSDDPGAHSSCALVERTAEEIRARVAARGRQALGGLHGTFATAIHEQGAQLLTLCRDRSGVKPLYFVPAPMNGVGVAFLVAPGVYG